MKTLVRMKFGSHLYGTSTEFSDVDWKSVHVPDAKDILLQRASAVTGVRLKDREGERNRPGDVDDESYALHRWLQLLAEGQTVAVDMMFAPDWAIDGTPSPVWRSIQANKDRLLTKKSAAFVGYCRTQANKYGIKGSRVAAAKRATEFFAQYLGHASDCRVGEIVFPETLFDEHTKIVQGEARPMDSVGVIRCETFFECCNRKVSFGNTVKVAHEIYSRIYENYGARARLAESNEGVDWKALSHAVRVGWEARELLITGGITFPIPNAKYLVDVKMGHVPYNDVAGQIEFLLTEVERCAAVSSLRDEPDRAFIDDLIADVYGEAVEAWMAKEEGKL